MRIIGVMVFLAGMVMFASGLVFLDLASLPLKNDLYSIDVLGFFNNMFSLNPSLATMQTVLSGLFVLMGCELRRLKPKKRVSIELYEKVVIRLTTTKT